MLSEDYVHIFLDVEIVIRYRHILPADNVGRAHEHGIAELVGYRNGVLNARHGKALGAFEIDLFEQGVETLPVLGGVYRVGGSTHDLNSDTVEMLGELDRRLPAESDYHALGLLHGEYAVDVLRSQRLEIKPVRHVEIGGNGFGVVVDYRNVVSEFLYRPHAMHARVIEFYSLSDPDRTRSENENGLFLLVHMLQSFVLFVVGGIEIRRFRVKLRGTRIHHFVDRIAVNGYLMSAYSLDSFVGIAVLFTSEISVFVYNSALYLLLVIREILEFIEEEAVYTGYLEYSVQGYPFLDRAEDCENPQIVHVREHRFDVLTVVAPGVEGVEPYLRAAYRFHYRGLEIGADTHHLSRRLHLRAESARGVYEFIERPLRELAHDIVYRRFEAGAGLARHLVGYLV